MNCRKRLLPFVPYHVKSIITSFEDIRTRQTCQSGSSKKIPSGTRNQNLQSSFSSTYLVSLFFIDGGTARSLSEKSQPLRYPVPACQSLC